LRTRDGRVVAFDVERIRSAIERAAIEVGSREPDMPARVAQTVVADLAVRFSRRAAGVEDVQDAVERALMVEGLADVARAYVLFRNRRAELREAKRMLGVRDELKLSLGACVVLAERYLRRDERGAVAESTAEMIQRVAAHVAAAEDGYERGGRDQMTARFARAMSALEFLPNSPTLMNAGTSLGLLSACFVLPLEDSLDSIFTTLLHTAKIHQAGGGTGFTFSRIRPAGDRVASTGGIASGPLSFLDLYDLATDVIGRGGRRRGANMAVLHVSHPDLREFVSAKQRPGRFERSNLSVAVTDAFMRAARRGGRHRFVNPRTGRVTGETDASELLDLIASAACESGDPGLLFIDRINRANPVPGAGRIEATNPCGEVPLLPNESCTLASVNLARHVREGRVDWTHLDATVALVVRFLDDVLDVNVYPDPSLADAATATRKIGVGVMGLAEMLAMLGIAYDSEAAVRLTTRVAGRVQHAARAASEALAEARGAFPRLADSIYANHGHAPRRNAQLTSIAPTGTISLLAGTTSSIEPMFAVAYVRRVLGRSLLEVNPLFERTARQHGFWSDTLMAEIAQTGTVRDCRAVPPDVRRAFVTAFDITPTWHLRMQAAAQRHVDAAVAKTINLPASATASDVRGILNEAWRAGVKGVTVYRDGSRPGQVLMIPSRSGEPVVVDMTYAGGCAGTTCPL
jgi:ribonucleoside-diphosphate reductase alpha chain